MGGQKTLDLIAQGNFGYADTVLNGTWTSLPGGAEQSPAWSNPATLAAYGAVSVVGALPNSQPQSASLVASTSASLCGQPVPCKAGTTCILLNPNPSGKIPSYGGMYGAPRPGRIHAGVDLQSPKGYQNWQRGPGENIRAAADGTVNEMIPVGGRCGGIVGISHPSPSVGTRYVHMVQTFVSYGQSVKRGQFVGVEGNETPAGCGSTGAHLHYEVYVAGAPTDPTKVPHDPPLPTHP